MIRHIVMWQFRDEAEGVLRAENLRQAKERLESLKERIPEIIDLEVGIDITRGTQSYDLALTTVFEDVEALARYQEHPDHVNVVGFLRKVHRGRTVVDYEIPSP
jgi:hypothetical protein